jgi:hypothetical protein
MDKDRIFIVSDTSCCAISAYRLVWSTLLKRSDVFLGKKRSSRCSFLICGFIHVIYDCAESFDKIALTIESCRKIVILYFFFREDKQALSNLKNHLNSSLFLSGITALLQRKIIHLNVEEKNIYKKNRKKLLSNQQEIHCFLYKQEYQIFLKDIDNLTLREKITKFQ